MEVFHSTSHHQKIPVVWSQLLFVLFDLNLFKIALVDAGYCATGCKSRHYTCAVLVFSLPNLPPATKTTRLAAQKRCSTLPTTPKETSEAEEETMSSLSQRLALMAGEGSQQISQNQQSFANVAHLDFCKNHRARSSTEYLFVNGAHVDQAKVHLGFSRVGRFSVQCSASGENLGENQTQRVQPRAPVGRGLRELSPVNHSRKHQTTPEFSSLTIGGKSYDALSRHPPSKQPHPPESLSLCANPKMVQEKLVKLSYKEPKSRQEFSSYFLHFTSPRPFYRAYSFI